MRVGGWCRLRAALALAVAALLATGCASLPRDLPRTPSVAVSASADTELGRIAFASAKDPALSGFRLMSWSEQSFAARLALAARAQRTLDLQYYVFDDDDTGRVLLRALRDAAVRGVRVRLLLDDLYTGGNDAMLLGLAAHPNVEVRLFNPFMVRYENVVARVAASLFDFDRVNHRMHNKLFIADGAMAIAGGRNIGDEYFMAHQGANYIDLDVFAVGAVLPTLAHLFDQYWNSEHVYPLEAIVPVERAGGGAAPPLRGGDPGIARAALAGAGCEGRPRPARGRRGDRPRSAGSDLGEGGGFRRFARQGRRPRASPHGAGKPGTGGDGAAEPDGRAAPGAAHRGDQLALPGAGPLGDGRHHGGPALEPADHLDHQFPGVDRRALGACRLPALPHRDARPRRAPVRGGAEPDPAQQEPRLVRPVDRPLPWQGGGDRRRADVHRLAQLRSALGKAQHRARLPDPQPASSPASC